MATNQYDWPGYQMSSPIGLHHAAGCDTRGQESRFLRKALTFKTAMTG